MGWLLVAWLTGAGVTTAPPDEPASDRFQFTRVEMAVPIRIVLYAPDASTATTTAEAAFARIHALNAILSDYDARSELRQLGNTATGGKTARVSNDLWQVLARARALADQSGGAFDPTVGPVVRLWRRARRNRQLPAPEAIEAARALVGYDLLRLDPDKQTVELLKPGMRLDLGGIAKGYAADEALRVLRNFGLNRALVDAGGDIVLGDPPPDQAGWHIAIAPLEADGPPSRVLSLCRTAIATSGDTWQFVEIDGRRYSHIVDPRTGLGLTDHSSVTIVAPDGTAADGLASAVSVLGPQKGIELIEGMPGTAAFIVRAPDGKLETHASRRWQELPVAVAPSPDEATREVP